MNPDNNNDGLVYKAAGFAIFVVLVTLIILISISGSDEPSKRPHETTDAPTSSEAVEPPVTDEAPTTTAQPPETTDAPETTAPPPETTAAPDTTTAAPPPANVTPTEFDPVEPPKSFATDTISAYLAEHPDAVLPETEDAGPDYIDKIIFLGDSTTYGLKAYSMLKDGRSTTQVWTPTNGTLTLSQANTSLILYPDTGEEITIKEAVKAKQPEILVITLGVNGVSFMGEEYFKVEYGKLVDSIKDASPDTKIILQSIFPVARTYAQLKSINNEKIDAANKWICELADDKDVKYVDTNSVLRDDEGWLPEDYHNGDGIHLKENSFTIELNHLRTHAWVD